MVDDGLFSNDLYSELSAIWHLTVLWGVYYCSQEMLIVGHNKLFACAFMINGVAKFQKS